MQGFMGSPDHRDTILYEYHKKVNIGIALDRYNTFIVQQFEGNHIVFEEMPTITDAGVLTLRGRTINGATFAGTRTLGASIYYHHPPRDLTKGQVSRTYCGRGSNGVKVAALRMPLSDGRHYSSDTFMSRDQPCPNPYNVSPNAETAQSAEKARQLWDKARETSQNARMREVSVHWITASVWDVHETSLDVRADLSKILNTRGKGVYTLVLWGNLRDERVVISRYSILLL